MHLHINCGFGFAFIEPQWCREKKLFIIYLMHLTLLFTVYSWSSGMNYQLFMEMENTGQKKVKGTPCKRKGHISPRKINK